MRDNRSPINGVLCKVMSMRGVYLIVFIILVPTFCCAQHSLYSTRNYTAIDGLPQSQVKAIVEDANGYLWLATQGGGLARFDGKEFKVYTTKDGLLSNDIMGLLLDRRQHVWILHARGLSKFDGTTFKCFQVPEDSKKPLTLRWFFEHGDSVFIITSRRSLAKIHSDSIQYWDKPIQPDRTIQNFHRDTAGVNYFYLDDGSFFIQTPHESFSFTPNVEVGKIHHFHNYKGEVHFNNGEAMYQLNYKDRSIRKLPWYTQHAVMLYNEKEDFFWTTNGATLFRETLTHSKPMRDTVLRDMGTHTVIVDSEGNTWFGTDGRGLFKYFIQDFKQFGSNDIRGVMAILKDKQNNTWIGTMTKGLWRISNTKIHSYFDHLPQNETFKNSIHTIKHSPDGTLWVGTGSGLGKYNKDQDAFTWIMRKDGLPGNNVITLAFDQHQGMWIGTPQGLSFYRDGVFKNYSTTHGLASNMVWSLHYSIFHKTLFVGNDFGIQSIKDSKVHSIKIAGLNNTNVYGIQPYRDSLLVLSTGGNGVVILNPKTSKHKFITSDDGLASDFIYLAVQDEKQNLWIGTEKGINRIKLNENLEMIENLFYGYDNGLTGVETNSNAFLISPHEKYFGLVDGLYKYNDVSNQPTKSFNLHLTDVKILYGEYSLRQYGDSVNGFFNIPFNPQLPPDRNHLTFYFNKVDKRYSKSLKFKYFLENFDTKWSQPASLNQVTYSNLPPGDYIFRVQSTDKKGSWSDQQIKYAFSVKAPFYQTASFLVAMFVLLAGMVTLILYLRVKQRVNKVVTRERIRVQEQENLRKEIARDFHDEMGNQLSRIINYISLLKLNGNGNGNGNANGSSNALYTKVEDSAKYLYSGTRDFIWAIDPVNDELSKLFIHIRDFGEKLFEEKSIQFRAFNDVKDKVKLPYGFSREANLIFKEAMTNAFKYSEARNVSLSLSRTSSDGFEMSIEDDGIGFLTDGVTNLNGLQNIRERADKIQTILRIRSDIHNGTKITLSFKLTKTLKYAPTI